MPLNIKCNFCSFAELRSFPFVFPYVLIAVYGDRPNLAEKNPEAAIDAVDEHDDAPLLALQL